MIDRHTKTNAKVLIIWLLALAAIWLLCGCKSGKNIGRSEARTDSTAQSEQTTIIEVFANGEDTKPTIEPKRTEKSRQAAQSKRRFLAADKQPLKPTLADKQCADVVADLIANGGGIVKITRTEKATSTIDEQQQELNKEVRRRHEWVFVLGLVVAVAVGMWFGRGR